MYEIDQSIIRAVQRIQDVSRKTEGLSGKVIGSLGEELRDIQSEVSSLGEISRELEGEMKKFKINGR